jgi:hypothetical protein
MGAVSGGAPRETGDKRVWKKGQAPVCTGAWVDEGKETVHLSPSLFGTTPTNPRGHPAACQHVSPFTLMENGCPEKVSTNLGDKVANNSSVANTKFKWLVRPDES